MANLVTPAVRQTPVGPMLKLENHNNRRNRLKNGQIAVSGHKSN
jgi:hypothetical protein